MLHLDIPSCGCKVVALTCLWFCLVWWWCRLAHWFTQVSHATVLSEQVKYRWTDLFLTGVDYTTEGTSAINNTNSFD